jgi:phosphoribosylformylglycinamidine synthase
MREVIDFANKGGYVFGVCNGFQILCESGLLPGTLQHNENRQFICKNVNLQVSSTDSLITRGLTKGEVLNIPIAHGEGNYYHNTEGLKELEDNDQVLFRYCDADGNVTPESNPNGALNNIAGITNKNRNVFGMMPHPERAADPELKNTDGRGLFESILMEVLA